MKFCLPFLSQMSLINLNPLATGFCQYLKCSKSISENQSYLQCDTLKCETALRNHIVRNKINNLTNNVQFTFDSCPKFLVCSKKVAYNHKAVHKAVLCGICNTWIHTKCNQLTIDDYEKFQNNTNSNFTCLQCHHAIFPFKSLNNQIFYTYLQKGVVLNDDTELELNPSPNHIAFMNKVTDQLRSFRFEENNEDSNVLEDIIS